MDDHTKEALGPALSEALEKKGYAELTPVQLAVLEDGVTERDVRMTSQTGSGKTVAIGLLLRHLVAAALAHESPKSAAGRPTALVITPTRELARQVESELRWLFAAMAVRVAVVTGGSSYGLERRALGSDPTIVVGTPGRLVDHLDRGSIDPAGLLAIVIDEADRMLDLGFREDLEKIIGRAPAGRRTHLVSATFPRDVAALANRVQTEPLHVEGTRLGDANLDIEHLLHLVPAHERFAGLVNLLLSDHDGRSIVFARTRAEVSDLSEELRRANFRVAALSGDMEQRERNRALAAFKQGELNVLVATDVAARGLDVAAVDRVVHYSPPTEPDAYTHRSGRTGRAGRRGTSHVLVAPRELLRVRRVLSEAKVTSRVEPLEAREVIEARLRESFVAELTAEGADEAMDPRLGALAKRLAEVPNVEPVLRRLLMRGDFARLPAPRDVTPVDAPVPRERESRRRLPSANDERGPRPAAGDWVPFRVTWGSVHGADPRRLLAMVCRRGGIQSRSVGAIRIGPTWSTVDVARSVAAEFSSAAAEPDPRDRRVTIAADRGPSPERGPRSTSRHEGPRHEGPRHEGPRPEGPRRDAPPGPRGPRFDAPRGDGPRRDGPRQDGPRRDGPARGGPSREDPRRDRPAHEAPHRDSPPREDTRGHDAAARERPRREGPRPAYNERPAPRADAASSGARPRDAVKAERPSRRSLPEAPPRDEGARPPRRDVVPRDRRDAPPAGPAPRDSGGRAPPRRPAQGGASRFSKKPKAGRGPR
ncbi:MAG: DEAD/DEAH box helicase [Myxococcales bacterium]|nr:DEAD/DEAH box helicase [Myxococcales bacterium]